MLLVLVLCKHCENIQTPKQSKTEVIAKGRLQKQAQIYAQSCEEEYVTHIF